MRWKAILLATLPLTNALSLANFQDITSIFIPFSCQFTYASTIPSCTVADFQDAGCSADCADALTRVAKNVSEACSNVVVDSDTLLGIVKNGGILQALCSTLQSSTSSQKPSATAVPENTKSSASPGQTQSTSASPISQSVITTSSHRTSRTVSSSQIVTSATKSSIEPTEAPSDTPTLTQTTESLSATQDEASAGQTSSATTTKSKPVSDGDSGGGSPFDISSNASKQFNKGSMLAFVIAAWASIFLGR